MSYSKPEFMQLLLLDADMHLKERVATYYDSAVNRYITLGKNNKFLALMPDFESAKAMHIQISYNRIKRVYEVRKENYPYRIIARNHNLDFSLEVITYYHYEEKYTTLVRINRFLRSERSPELPDYCFSWKKHFSETLQDAMAEHDECVTQYIISSSGNNI